MGQGAKDQRSLCDFSLTKKKRAPVWNKCMKPAGMMSVWIYLCSQEKYLEKVSFGPSHPASFKGPLRSSKLVKKEGSIKYHTVR